MGLKEYIQRFKENYIKNKVARAETPEFPSSPIVRKKIIFSGKVQNVGFRFEIFNLAKKLELKGWVKNMEDDTVKLEIQGEENRIQFLVKHMKSLKRANVAHVEVDKISLVEDESDFNIIM